MFFGRNDAKAETPVLWPPHVKCWLIGKDSDAGRGWGQEEKGTTEDEMAGWHHRLDGREFEWTPGVGDGQGGLACCDSWGHKESDMTEWLNWTELKTSQGLLSTFMEGSGLPTFLHPEQPDFYFFYALLLKRLKITDFIKPLAYALISFTTSLTVGCPAFSWIQPATGTSLLEKVALLGQFYFSSLLC